MGSCKFSDGARVWERNHLDALFAHIYMCAGLIREVDIPETVIVFNHWRAHIFRSVDDANITPTTNTNPTGVGSCWILESFSFIKLIHRMCFARSHTARSSGLAAGRRIYCVFRDFVLVSTSDHPLNCSSLITDSLLLLSCRVLKFTKRPTSVIDLILQYYSLCDHNPLPFKVLLRFLFIQ